MCIRDRTKIVDALGGVDVYSEQTFTTKVMQIPDKNGNLYRCV